MEALDEELKVKVESAGLLAFQGPIYGVGPAENSSPGGCIAAKCVGAGIVRAGAIWALRAEPYPQDMAHGEANQHHEAIGAS